MNRSVRVVAAALVLALGALPALAQVSPEDIDRAEERLSDLRSEMAELTDRYEEAVSRTALLEAEVIRLSRAVAAAELAVQQSRTHLREQAVEMYMAAATSSMSMVFQARSPADMEAGLGYLNEVTVSGGELLRQLEASRAELGRQVAELERARLDQTAAAAELEELSVALGARLDEAQRTRDELVARRAAEEEARRRAEEEARRRAAEEAQRRAEEEARRVAAEQAAATTTTSTTVVSAPDPVTTTVTPPPPAPEPGARFCPVDGFTVFSDTWGAPRSGGRTHQGVDMLAARGTPAVAIEAGTVARLGRSGLGGITVWLRGDSGDSFYYAHLDRWAPGLSRGQRLAGGEVLGFVGTTGNAPASVPHLHFEHHPGGGAAVNPYPLVRSLCT